jgi:hypothetical protein
MDKGNNKDKAGKPKEVRSVFHDDDNLQDEQEAFDRENAGLDVKKAVEGIKRLMEQKEAEKKKGGSSGK